MNINRSTKYLTLSVDDGHPKDRKTAELMHNYGVRATFYIPIKNPERELMGKSDILAIASRFEIGGHTYSHRPLNRLSQETIDNEIRHGKVSLEQMLGKQVIAFCYPKGKFNPTAAAIVRDAGFHGARTCRYFQNTFPKNPYYWGVSTHAANHSVSIQMRHAILEKNFHGLFDFFRVHKARVDWTEQFMLAVKYVQKHGGIAHLYLHSWEIEANHDWKRFEGLLGFLSKSNLTSVTNGELFKLHRANTCTL